MTFAFRLFTALAAAVTPFAAHAQAADPAARLAAYNDAVVAIMKARLAPAARVERFETAVRAAYDMPGIAALVVGAKWAATPPAERDAAIAALTRHSAVSLARNFVSYDGQRFVVDPAIVTRGASRVVKVTIQSKGRADVLLYRLREAGGEWRIVDVIAGGVSQLAVQRADLAGTVASGGVAGLTKQLARIDALPAGQR